MQSKNKPAPTKQEHAHIERLKEFPCVVCDDQQIPEIHELVQGDWFTSIPLCPSCHRHPVYGWHGQRQTWKLKKLDELGALNETLRKLL